MLRDPAPAPNARAAEGPSSRRAVRERARVAGRGLGGYSTPNPQPRTPVLLTDLDARPVIAHRGASAYAPENTMLAFDLALDLGAEALEFDLRLTSDGVPVVHHDPTLLRTAGVAAAVGSLTLDALQTVDAGCRFTPDAGRTFPFRGHNIRVPRLVEVLRRFPDTPLLIELKEVQVAAPALRVLEDAGAAYRCVIAGFDAAALVPFRRAPWNCGAATADAARLYFPAMAGLRLPEVAVKAYSVPVRWRGLPIPTRRFVRAAHSGGAAVHVWTVDDPALAKALWKRGANGMVTNRPDVIRGARDE